MTTSPTARVGRSRRWLRIALGSLVPLAVIAVWFQRPLGPEDAEGTVRLSGSCCADMNGAPSFDVDVGSRADDGMQVLVSFDDLVWGHGQVHGDTTDFIYWIERAVPSEWSGTGRVTAYDVERRKYTSTGLRVGDTMTHGPVTIEVVAIHDMILNRNNAVDLRVTVDETRLADAP